MISETSGWPNTATIENGGNGARSMKSIIVYNVSLNLDDLAVAAEYNSLLWVTSAKLPNPYNSLPSYVAQLFADLDSGS